MWDYTGQRLRPFGRVIRVENPACPGTPDVYYVFPSSTGARTGWMENKHLDKRPTTYTPLLIPTLTLAQVTWAEDEVKAGGRSTLLLRVGKAFFLLAPRVIRGVYNRQLTYDILKQHAIYYSERGFKAAELVRCLKS